MSDQPHVTLNDGYRLPQLGFGVFQVPEAEADTIVARALDTGFARIDTAAIYGNESGVGAALASQKSSAVVTTKLWNDSHEPHQARAALQASLRRLGRPVVDLYLIHWPVQASDFVGTWKALIDFRAEGLVRSIGVSNFTIDNLKRIVDATGIVPAVNQIELHPGFQQRALRDFHDQVGIRTESWSPLGRGGALQSPEILSLARTYGKTPAQIVLRWHLDLGLMVIPKSVTPARIRENFDVFDFTLKEVDRQRIASLDRPDGRIGPDPMTFG